MMNAFQWTMLAMFTLCWLRGNIVYRVGLRRLAEIRQVHDREIATGTFVISKVQQRYEEFGRPTFLYKVLDLRKWTYKQFYPNPIE